MGERNLKVKEVVSGIQTSKLSTLVNLSLKIWIKEEMEIQKDSILFPKMTPFSLQLSCFEEKSLKTARSGQMQTAVRKTYRSESKSQSTVTLTRGFCAHGKVTMVV